MFYNVLILCIQAETLKCFDQLRIAMRLFPCVCHSEIITVHQLQIWDLECKSLLPWIPSLKIMFGSVFLCCNGVACQRIPPADEQRS